MDDSKIRELLRKHKRSGDGPWCVVYSSDPPEGTDLPSVSKWVLRQEDGQVTRHGGGEYVTNVQAHPVERWERYAFPCAALDG